MLVIAHRGAQENKHENTVAALKDAIRIDADMIEIDVRLTKDKVPVLSHNSRLYGTKRRELTFVRRYTLDELQKRTAGSEHPITTLDTALKTCFGKIYLNIEIKEASAVGPTIEVVRRYAKKQDDWDSLLFSSFKPLALRSVRKQVPHAALGLLHRRNPFVFLGWHRQLNLSAVGFHRLYVNTFALQSAKILGLFTYSYTINRKEAALKLLERGVDGIVTDMPTVMLELAGRNNI